MAAFPPLSDGGAEPVQDHSSKLNKETFREILGDSLPGIEKVHIVAVQLQPLRQRFAEQLFFSVMGSLVAAAIAFFVGLYVGSGDGLNWSSMLPHDRVEKSN